MLLYTTTILALAYCDTDTPSMSHTRVTVLAIESIIIHSDDIALEPFCILVEPYYNLRCCLRHLNCLLKGGIGGEGGKMALYIESSMIELEIHLLTGEHFQTSYELTRANSGSCCRACRTLRGWSTFRDGEAWAWRALRG